MKKNPNNITDTQKEMLIQHALRTGGFLFPETPEEVIEFEKQFGSTDVVLPEDLRKPTFLDPKISTVIKKKPLTATENLAMAAREGSQLPEQILKRMKEHRDKAKTEKQKDKE